MNLIKQAAVDAAEAVGYRTPMRVTAMRGYKMQGKQKAVNTYPICPRCETTMEREYQAYCDRCGQALDWTGFSHVPVIVWDD